MSFKAEKHNVVLNCTDRKAGNTASCTDRMSGFVFFSKEKRDRVGLYERNAEKLLPRCHLESVSKRHNDYGKDHGSGIIDENRLEASRVIEDE